MASLIGLCCIYVFTVHANRLRPRSEEFATEVANTHANDSERARAGVMTKPLDAFGESLVAVDSTLAFAIPRGFPNSRLHSVDRFAQPVTMSETAAHPAFELVKEEFVDEIEAPCAWYRHKASGAEVLSVKAADDNKFFKISFRTLPSDSTGVAHILEHSVCHGGSRKYPVDAYSYMRSNSMHTLLGAKTHPDNTEYSTASRNLKDFYNLVDVNLDGVFHPRVISDQDVFLKEGWRYELEDPQGPLICNGVVYNEMKQFGSLMQTLMENARHELFPDITYGVNFVGDPREMRNLPHEGLRDFHRRFYHPANSRIFFYGDDPPAERLTILDGYLSEFKKIPVDFSIGTQGFHSAPRKVVKRFPQTPESGSNHLVSVSWMLSETELTPKESIEVGVLWDILWKRLRSALKTSELYNSNLGEVVYFDSHSHEVSLKQPYVAVVLTEVKPDEADKVETLVLETLKQIAADGFDPLDALDSLENVARRGFDPLRSPDHGMDETPYGDRVSRAAMSRWCHGGDPIEAMRVRKILDELAGNFALREGAERLSFGMLGNKFEGMLDKMFLSNPHRVTVQLVPDDTLQAEQEAEDAAALAKVKASMDEAAITDLIASTKRLKAFQGTKEAPEDIAKMPVLTKEDINTAASEIPIDVRLLPGTKSMILVEHRMPTLSTESMGLNVDIGFDLSRLTRDQLMLLPLFSAFLSRDNPNPTSCLVAPRADPDRRAVNGDDFVAYFLAHFEFANDELKDEDFTQELIDYVLLQLTEPFTQEAVLKSLPPPAKDSLVTVKNWLSARYTLSSAIAEEVDAGLSAFTTREAMRVMAQQNWPAVLEKLNDMRAILLDRDSMVISLSGATAAVAAAKQPINDFPGRLPEAGKAPLSGAGLTNWRKLGGLLPRINEGWDPGVAVNMIGFGGRLFEPGEKITGANAVVASFLRERYLYENIRSRGGAYVHGCDLHPEIGTFTFYSERDPNLERTLEVFASSAEYLEGLTLSNEEIQQAVIGAFRKLDPPMSSRATRVESLRRHLTGETLAMRQAWRDEMFATTVEDFKAFGKRLATFNDKATAVVFADSEKLLNSKFKGGFKLLSPSEVMPATIQKMMSFLAGSSAAEQFEAPPSTAKKSKAKKRKTKSGKSEIKATGFR